MNDCDIVCDCYRVTVKDVNDYLDDPNNKDKPVRTQIADLMIAQACRFCMDKDEPKIDVHFSELLGDLEDDGY